MPLYFRSDAQNKTYKLDESEDICYIYYVQVSATRHSFTHARGRDHVRDLETAKKLMETLEAVPVSEQDYISALKDYFAIDKKVREQFIKSYNL